MRRLAVLRVRLAPWLLLAPALLVAASDLVRRWHRVGAWGGGDRARYALALAESAALWGVLLLLAARRRGAVRWLAAFSFVFFGGISLGIERYFYDRFDSYLNLDAAIFGAAFPKSLTGHLGTDLPELAWALGLPLVYFAAIATFARRWVRPNPRWSRVASVAAPLLVALAVLLPCSFRTVQAATPDVIWLHAMGGLARHLWRGKAGHVEPGLRKPPYLPALTPAPAARRNVLFVLTESVRFDAVCVEPGPGCQRSPFTDRAAPERIPLLQMRSNSSTTAISFGVLLSGLAPTETRDSIHTAPLLFDYAHAAGYDTAYLTSQHLMFAHSEAFVRDLPVSRRCGATDLDPEADIDMGANDRLLTERALAELPRLTEPWFAIVHYSSTHFPYRVEDGSEPFQPASESKAPEDNAELFNYYRNAVYAQDRTMADLLLALRGGAAGPRTVVVYTSDHGEAFREHGQLGHTGAVLDAEIRVPAWIDAPEGTLTPGERAVLGAAKDELAWHTDLTPTVLDLLGLHDAPELARYRAKMTGGSLLRERRRGAVIPLTNCSELWGCAFRNWGLMRGPLKLEAREWDPDWHCYDVLRDPEERRDLGREACGELLPAVPGLLGGHPRDLSDRARGTEED